MLRCKLTAVGIEYNYVVSLHRTTKLKKKNHFVRVCGDSDPMTSINSNYIKIAAFSLRVSFAVTGN